MDKKRPVFCMTVDMDEWYQCRWATGKEGSIWPDTKTFFREWYKSDGPAGELVSGVDKLLEILRDAGVKATFFTLGETAEHYPDTIARIAAAGHEIACHSYYHTDLFRLSREEFDRDLKRAKALLESVSGQEVLGFRAPSLTMTELYMGVLAENGFLYDSSVSNLRPMFGRYRGFHGTPQVPYRASETALRRPGNGRVVELPLPSFPILHVPASMVIMHRIFGSWVPRTAIAASLRRGYAMYYCHPYDLNPAPEIPDLKLTYRIFLRRTGPWYVRELARLLGWAGRHGVEFLRCCDLVRQMPGFEECHGGVSEQ